MAKLCKACICKAQGETKDKKQKIERITELYAGVFTVPLGGDLKAENIVIGIRYGVAQATVEHHVGAVPSMINLCDEISSDKGWKWRLLRFSKEGMQELNPDDYRGYNDFCQRARLQ